MDFIVQIYCKYIYELMLIQYILPFKMINQILLSVIIVLMGSIIKYYYSNILKTKQKMLMYKSSFEQAGYKVKFYPFKFFQLTWFSEIIDYQTKYDNCYKFYQSLKGYDIAIGCGFNKPSIAIISPNLLKEYYQAPVGDYIKFRASFKNVERLFGAGILLSQGNESKRKRKIISQVFHYDFVKSIVPNAKQCFSFIFDQIDKKQIDSINLIQIFKDLFCNITINSFFGNQGYKCLINNMEFSKFFVKLLEDVCIRNSTSFGFIFPYMLKYGLFQIDRSINERVKLFNEFTQNYINEMIEKFNKMSPEEIKIKKYKDIFAAMYFSGYVNAGQKNELNFSLKEFIEQFATFATAGTETTAVHITNMLYNISQNPQVKTKLLEQINQHIKSDQDNNPQTIKKMKYLNGVSQQSFRLTPPTSGLFMRITTKEVKLGGITLQKDMPVFFDIAVAKGTDQNYFEDPYSFKPQRWFERIQNPYVIIPFSAGTRNCIGQHMADILSKIMLISFLRRYDFEINQKVKWHMIISMTPLPFKTKIKRKSN